MDYLTKLNSVQRQAVEYGAGPLLVLAGAGSGKTRVLTHRIVHLISHYKVDPSQIFAVTFTNKAAAEMRHRVNSLLSTHFNMSLREGEPWVSTFHSACVRILRSDIHHLGFSNQFSIYDDKDQLSVIKAAMKELNVNEQMIPAKSIQSRINRVKNEGKDVFTYIPTFGGPSEDLFMRVFERYTDVLKLSSALDFADLILLTVQLFEKNPHILHQYQERFQHLLIDEYQDTNRCQYLMMRALAGERKNICAVGDEDQSIYSWRGADVSNILNFERDFSRTQIFKLEENYRSTKNIIEAASQVIAFNENRRDKQLWTSNEDGDKLHLIEAYDEQDEANKLVDRILDKLSQNGDLSEIAIFYRTNAQSRLLEDRLRQKGVNYQIYGGLKFYERLEVKDMLAYLSLLVNPDDDVSFRRIVNVPARGIGAVSIKRLGDQARENGLSHYGLLKAAFSEVSSVNVDFGRAKKNFRKFYDLMLKLERTKEDILPSDLLSYILEESGYRQHLIDSQTVEAQTRLENLSELRQSIVEFELRSGSETPDKEIDLSGFLEQVALVSDLDKSDPNSPALKMMTIHMAKGLEFNTVYILGLEEELFPNIRPWEGEDPTHIEEERRLFYVGMTRARKELSLFYAKNRTVFGNAHFRVLSRFVEEIPTQYLEMEKADYFERRGGFIERPGLPPSEFSHGDELNSMDASEYELVDECYDDENSYSSIRRGSRIEHPQFGVGVVLKTLGADKAIIEFPGKGQKKVSLKWGQLKLV